MKLFGAIVLVSGLVAVGCSSSQEGTQPVSSGGAGGTGGAAGQSSSTTKGPTGATGGTSGSTGATTTPPTGGSGGSGGSGGTTVTRPVTSGGSAAGGRPGTTTVSGGGGTGNTGATKPTGGNSGLGASGGTSAVGGGTSTGGSSFTPKVCAASGVLKEAGACNNKLIGAALAQSQISNTNDSTAAKEHNYITPENEMKWDTVEASRGSFNFGPGNAIINFASSNGMKVKGHTLVWHSQLPNWVSSLSSAADVKTVMTDHITKVMTAFKGKIYAWDVVNEAWETPDKKGNGTATLRKSVFMDKLGKDFIDIAFQTAKAADPAPLLFYNDYSTEGMNDKSNAVYEMVKSMKERGIPIDGVGLQMHIGTPNDTPTAAEVKQNIDRLAALGLQVVISEMDINGCDGFTADSMAQTYHDIVAACVSQPLCTAITFWGLSDSGSWLNSFSEAGCNGKSPTPLLWDSSYKKKGTYTAVIKALTGN